MYIYDLCDILFLIKSFQNPSQHFDMEPSKLEGPSQTLGIEVDTVNLVTSPRRQALSAEEGTG